MSLNRKGKTIGFVPTMGALHKGHISLIRRASLDSDVTVVSIFVNPAQFSPSEDFKKYPRDFSRDKNICKKEKVDVLFYPSAGQMYPPGYNTVVKVSQMDNTMCGKSRPGHFTGVATVVLKLLNITQPTTAYFGQKDAQQAAVIQRMSKDLNLPVRIKVLPIVRDNDGLALSSRNSYLDKGQRQDALILYRALMLAKNMIKGGEKDVKKIIRAMNTMISGNKNIRLDYIVIVDPLNLKPKNILSGNCLIALAAWLGKTRLIDNIIVRNQGL